MAGARNKKTEMGGLVPAHISDLLAISKMTCFCKLNITVGPSGPPSDRSPSKGNALTAPGSWWKILIFKLDAVMPPARAGV